MNFSLNKKRLLAFIAMTAILLNALAPSISHALSGKPSLPWQEICTQNSIKLMVTELTEDNGIKANSTTQENDKTPVGRLPMVDCGYCVTHAGSDSVSIKPFALTTLALAPGVFPPLFYSSPDKLFIWAASNPRAPPISLSRLA